MKARSAKPGPRIPPSESDPSPAAESAGEAGAVEEKEDKPDPVPVEGPESMEADRDESGSGETGLISRSEETEALRTEPEGDGPDLPADRSRLTPRAAAADAFEQNPLASVRAKLEDGGDRLNLDDGLRVREALLSVMESGESVRDAARDWRVAPSAITSWRSRYQDLLASGVTAGVPLMDADDGPKHAGDAYIPEAARELFLENWARLVAEAEADAATFRQSPVRIFLETSPLTGWLYQEGKLERGLLAGVLSGVAALAVLASFLLARRNPPPEVAVPEPPVLENLIIGPAALRAQQFFKAPDWKERLKFIRDPESMRSQVEAYYQNHPDGPISDAALSLAMPLGTIVNLSFDIPSQGRSHFLCMVRQGEQWVVDWESSSLYQEAHLTAMREARSTEPTRIAVTVRRSEELDYYNYAFRDPEQWVCFQLGYPGMEATLYGYAKKDSSDAISLLAMLGILHQQAVLLEVRYPEDAASDNQVEILNVLREEWVPVAQ